MKKTSNYHTYPVSGFTTMIILKRVVTSFLFVFGLFSLVFCQTWSADVDFYGTKQTLFYNNSVLEQPDYSSKESFIPFYYLYVDSLIVYEGLFDNLQRIKRKKKLNDWLYYNLIHNSVMTILEKEREAIQNLFTWFILSKSGYSTKVEYKGKDVTIHVYTNDLIYGVPQTRSKGGYWVDLTSFRNTINYEKFVPFKVDFYPNKEDGKFFSFALNEIPQVFESKAIQKELVYEHQGNTFKINGIFDKGYADFLNQYPEFSLSLHARTPISDLARKSLVDELKTRINTQDTLEAVRHLLSFTRTAFKYKSDLAIDDNIEESEENLEKVIFFPEEVLLSDFSDYEDRSVLFCYLAKEVMGMNPILLKISKITSVALSFGDTIGRPIAHNNLIYALCEPTDPENLLEIGQFPKKYENRYFKVFNQ